MPLKTSASEELPNINLTPMIDVVFLLIIFFMAGTQFSEAERQIGLKLPGAGELKAMIAPPDRREIVVTSDGRVMLDGATMSVEQITQQLRALLARYPELKIVIRADGKVEYQQVVSVMGAAQRAGVSELSTAVLYQPQLR